MSRWTWSQHLQHPFLSASIAHLLLHRLWPFSTRFCAGGPRLLCGEPTGPPEVPEGASMELSSDGLFSMFCSRARHGINVAIRNLSWPEPGVQFGHPVCAVTHKLCPVGVGSQVIPSVAGTSHAFAPSSAPGCPNPPALAASTQLVHSLLFVTLSQRHIPIAEKTTCLVSSTAAHTLGQKFVFYTTSRYRPVYRPVSALQFQTRAARVMPAAPQTLSTGCSVS